MQILWNRIKKTFSNLYEILIINNNELNKMCKPFSQTLFICFYDLNINIKWTNERCLCFIIPGYATTDVRIQTKPRITDKLDFALWPKKIINNVFENNRSKGKITKLEQLLIFFYFTLSEKTLSIAGKVVNAPAII